MALRLQTMLWAGIRLGATASVLAMATTSAYAQEVTGTIRGDVQDDAGNPIPGATVTVTHVPSGTRSVQTTDGSGSFSAPNLRVGGPFDITVAAPGFDSAQTTIVSIQSGQPQRVGVVLVGEGATIEVTAGRAPSSITLATGPTTSLDARAIAGVANVNRDIRNLAARDPLVSLDPTNGNSISIAGQNNRFNRISVDGIAFGDPFGLESGGLASSRGPIPLDAIGEFTVETAPVDIQQGGFQGGAINTVLKSGGNDFTFTGFFTYSNDSLTGTKTRNRTVTQDFTSKIFGAQFTGPLIKDKLFFAVTWERVRAETPALVGIPGEGFGNEIPIISRAQVDQVAQISNNVYNYDPLDIANNVPENDDKVVVKLDWNISDRHRAAFTYVYAEGNILAGQTGLNQAGPGVNRPILSLQSNNYNQGSINHYGVAQINSEWSDSFSTQVRVSHNDYERLQVPFNGREFGQFLVCLDPVSVGSLTQCNATSGQVRFGPDNSRQANELFVKTWGFEFQAQISKNNHNVKLIAERRSQDFNNLFAQNVSGQWFFDSVADLQNRRANQLIYAAPNDGDINSVAAQFKNINWTFGVQDVWDVTSDVTFVYGVRYDLYETDDVPAFNANFLARNGFANNNTLNGRGIVQPRFGLTWRADERLQVRASAGLFAGGAPNVWISNSYSNPGPLLSSATVARTATGFTGVADFGGLTANELGALVLDNVSGGTGVPDIFKQFVTRGLSSLAVTNAIAPDFEIPSQWRVSGSVDYSANLGPLGDDWNIGGSVIWSKVKDALIWTDLRSIPIGVLPDGRTRYGQRPNTAGSGGSNITDNNQDVLLTNTSQGYSWNIVGKFDKRFDNGFSLGGAYTWQRVKDRNPGTSSVALSNYNSAASSDPNFAAYGTSNYQIDNSVQFRLGYDAKIFGDSTTRFEAFYTSRSGQRFSHTFQDSTPNRSSVFGTTGTNNRYLLYVPNVSSATADANVIYAPGFDFASFQSFIQNGVLDDYQGRIADKNLGKSPRFNKLDIRIAQEVPFFLDGRVELFGDMENVLNFINKDWGSLRQVSFPYQAALVNVACATPACSQYVYSNFRKPTENLFTNQSLWQIRVGARLSF